MDIASSKIVFCLCQKMQCINYNSSFYTLHHLIQLAFLTNPSTQDSKFIHQIYNQ